MIVKRLVITFISVFLSMSAIAAQDQDANLIGDNVWQFNSSLTRKTPFILEDEKNYTSTDSPFYSDLGYALQEDKGYLYYRYQTFIPEKLENEQLAILIEGLSRHSTVWINEIEVGTSSPPFPGISDRYYDNDYYLIPKSLIENNSLKVDIRVYKNESAALRGRIFLQEDSLVMKEYLKSFLKTTILSLEFLFLSLFFAIFLIIYRIRNREPGTLFLIVSLLLFGAISLIESAPFFIKNIWPYWNVIPWNTIELIKTCSKILFPLTLALSFVHYSPKIKGRIILSIILTLFFIPLALLKLRPYSYMIGIHQLPQFITDIPNLEYYYFLILIIGISLIYSIFASIKENESGLSIIPVASILLLIATPVLAYFTAGLNSSINLFSYIGLPAILLLRIAYTLTGGQSTIIFRKKIEDLDLQIAKSERSLAPLAAVTKGPWELVCTNSLGDEASDSLELWDLFFESSNLSGFALFSLPKQPKQGIISIMAKSSMREIFKQNNSLSLFFPDFFKRLKALTGSNIEPFPGQVVKLRKDNIVYSSLSSPNLFFYNSRVKKAKALLSDNQLATTVEDCQNFKIPLKKNDIIIGLNSNMAYSKDKNGSTRFQEILPTLLESNKNNSLQNIIAEIIRECKLINPESGDLVIFGLKRIID